MSDCHLPDITRPHADGAAAAPQPRSLMLEAPPRPPSPYRPRNHRRVGQTLPDLFQAKYEAFARRQKDTMLLHQAEKESERKMELERSSRRKPMVRMLPKGTIIKRISPEEQERMDRALAEYHFHEAQRQQLVKEELEEYINMTTEEELTFTQFLVDHLQVAAEFVVHDDTSAREETRRNVVERYEGRDTMMFNIAEATARHFTEERIAKMIAEYIQYLLQQHRAGVEEIAEEEAEDLQRVLLWEEESRPIGTGIKVGTTEDPRLRHLRKKPKRVRPGKVIEKTPTELCLEKLREKSSALVVVESDANDAGVAAQEGEYLLDGRALLEQDRERQRLAILRSNALVHLHEKEQRGREEVQYEESMSWLPILLHGVDGIYEARRHTKEREAREEREEAVRAEEEEFCADIKLRILAENIEVREEDYLVEEDPVEVENARIAAAIRGRQEATNTTLFPSLNLVMDLAMKQDTLGTLHNPTFAMVSAVEREIAEEEGRPMGSVARQFQVDERDIFTPDYLVHVLWCGDLDLPNMHHHFEDLQKQEEEEEEAAEMLQDFISTMLRERSLLIQEGICESWKLYNYAAEESANVSFTAAGSVFYQGVQHPDT